jgi:hypothetical protein
MVTSSMDCCFFQLLSEYHRDVENLWRRYAIAMQMAEPADHSGTKHRAPVPVRQQHLGLVIGLIGSDQFSEGRDLKIGYCFVDLTECSAG